jgi:hypothetical protein
VIGAEKASPAAAVAGLCLMFAPFKAFADARTNQTLVNSQLVTLCLHVFLQTEIKNYFDKIVWPGLNKL